MCELHVVMQRYVDEGVVDAGIWLEKDVIWGDWGMRWMFPGEGKV